MDFDNSVTEMSDVWSCVKCVLVSQKWLPLRAFHNIYWKPKLYWYDWPIFFTSSVSGPTSFWPSYSMSNAILPTQWEIPHHIFSTGFFQTAYLFLHELLFKKTQQTFPVYIRVLSSSLPLIQKVILLWTICKANLLISSLKDSIRADKCHLPWEYCSMTPQIGWFRLVLINFRRVMFPSALWSCSLSPYFA